MKELFSPNHPFRIFLITGLITILALVAVGILKGPEAFLLAIILTLVEITFSFDNAIINAKVLATMSRFWQTLFMTVGIFIAVFGMRLVFPILIVMITANLSAGDVVNLAFSNPEQYSQKLNDSHVAISGFGGMFLLMLSLHFFFDTSRKTRWISTIEAPLQRIGTWWMHAVLSSIVLVIISLIPINEHPKDTLVAGALGIITYLTVHGLADLFTKRQGIGNEHGGTVIKTGMAGFISFIYLEILDASFSFDGVIGAFAITQDVVLIAVGLGIGALWVRSLTLYMVRKEVLDAYRYLEHGAHYTIGLLAAFLLSGLFLDIPEAVAGVSGLLIITAAITSSIVASKRRHLN